MDSYNHSIYPGDHEVRPAIGRDLRVQRGTTDEEYLEDVKSIQKDMREFRPDFVVYNAGTDILEGDQLGRL